MILYVFIHDDIHRCARRWLPTWAGLVIVVSCGSRSLDISCIRLLPELTAIVVVAMMQEA
jgi:hypothetical protein